MDLSKKNVKFVFFGLIIMIKMNKRSLVLALSLLSSLPALSADCTSGSYSTPGTSTCSVPAGVNSIDMTLFGGSGGYGGNSANATGGQGGVGGYCNGTVVTVPGQSITVVVGSGQSASGADGGDGGQAQISGPGVGNITIFTGGGEGGDGASGSQPGQGGVGGTATCAQGQTSYAGFNGADGAATSSTVSSGMSGGNGSVSFTLSAPVTPPAPIPTLGEWAMIFMASLMAMFGIRRMRRSK